MRFSTGYANLFFLFPLASIAYEIRIQGPQVAVAIFAIEGWIASMQRDEFTRPQYVNRDVLKATGISLGTLQTWLNRGLIRPSSDINPGTGQRRMYSTADVLRAAIMNRLTDFGVSISVAADMCQRIGSDVPTSTMFLQMLSIDLLPADSHWLLFYRQDQQHAVTNHLSNPELPENGLEALIRKVGTCIVLEVGTLVKETLAKLGETEVTDNGN